MPLQLSNQMHILNLEVHLYMCMYLRISLCLGLAFSDLWFRIQGWRLKVQDFSYIAPGWALGLRVLQWFWVEGLGFSPSCPSNAYGVKLRGPCRVDMGVMDDKKVKVCQKLLLHALGALTAFLLVSCSWKGTLI